GFLIKYPDTVDGEISVTASAAPVRLVANTSGRIYLLRPNKSMLNVGEVIAYIESGADFTHILLLDSLLSAGRFEAATGVSLPDTLILGEIGTLYSSFVLACAHHRRLQASDIYETMRESLRTKIASDVKVFVNMGEELRLKQTMLDYVREQLEKDSLLWQMKGMSEQDYRSRQNSYLSQLESLVSLQSSRLAKQSEVSQNDLEIQRITLEEMESKEKALSELTASRNALVNAINVWKEQYLQYAPIAGEVEYLGFWRSSAFVQAGSEVFSIIPLKSDIVGEVELPSYGSGKVEVGQAANIKISSYPHDEYGIIEGVVQSLSRMTNKIQTKDGIGDVYLATISFPNGTVTNFGKELPLDFEAKGTVEIITKPKRLFERLFDNLKSKAVK
ncbi:MAG: HlyD family secretion protein, partial [Prevotellaceae bacterium]|nr:HlyD family secretion protein [Prevotellaceae bacterium]